MSNTEIPDEFWDELTAELTARPEQIAFPLQDRAAFEAAGGSYAFSNVFNDPNTAIQLLQRLAPSQETVTLERQRQLAVEEAVFERMLSDPLMGYYIKNWDRASPEHKEQVAAEVARVHSHTLGYEAPDVSSRFSGFANADEANGQFVSSGGLEPNRIEVNLDRPFSAVLETLLHENTHNHQDQLRLRGSEGLSVADSSLQQVLQVTWDQAEHPQAYFHLPREVHARDWQQVGERIAHRAGLIHLPPEKFPARDRPYATQYELAPIGIGADDSVRYYTTDVLTASLDKAMANSSDVVDAPEVRGANHAGHATGVGLGAYGLVSRAGQTAQDLDENTLAGLSSVVGTGADAADVVLSGAGMIDDAAKGFAGMSDIAGRAAVPLAVVSTLGEMGAGIATGDEVRTVKAAGGLGGALLGAQTLGAAGASLGPWGAAAGGLVGGIIGGLAGEEAIEALMGGNHRGLSSEEARAQALMVLTHLPMHPDAVSYVPDRSLQELTRYVHNVLEIETQLAEDPENARLIHSHNLAKTAMMNGLDAYVQTHEPEQTMQVLGIAEQRWKGSEEYQWMLEDMAAEAGGLTNAVLHVGDETEARGATDLGVNNAQSTRTTQI